MNTLLAKIFNNKVFKSISILSLENIFRIAVGFFVGVWVARSLGPEEYGIFSFILSVIMLVTPFYTFGTDEYLVGHLVKDRENKNSYMTSALLLKIFGGFISISLLLMYAFFAVREDDVDVWNYIFLFSFIMFFRSLDVFDNWYQSLVEAKKVSLVRSFVIGIAAALKLLGLYYALGWKYFVLISGLEIALLEVGYVFVFFIVDRQKLFLSFDRSILSDMLKKSRPLMLLMFLDFALMRLDQIMIREFLGDSALGKFSVAVKLVEIWRFLPVAICTSLYPSIVASFQDQTQYKNKVVKSYSIMFWLALSFVGSIYIIAGPLVEHLYGEKYLDSILYLKMYSVLTFFSFFIFARTKILAIEKLSSIGVLISTISIVLNVVLNFYFIQKFQVMGAIYSSLLSYIVPNVIFSVVHEGIRRNTLYFIESIFYPLKIIKSELFSEK